MPLAASSDTKSLPDRRRRPCRAPGCRMWRSVGPWPGPSAAVGAAGVGSSAGRVDRELGPALARLGRELVHQRDGAGVVVAGAGLDPAVADHAVHQLAADVGAHDGERPVVERADAAGGDVGVLGREVGAHLAALARPRVALLQRDLVVVAVVHPDLEDALDVHLLHVGLLQAVLRLEELLEDGVVERLRAQQADVEREPAGDLARLALLHHRRHRRLAAHADERDALGAALDRVGVGERVGRVRVAAPGGGDDVFAVRATPGIAFHVVPSPSR